MANPFAPKMSRSTFVESSSIPLPLDCLLSEWEKVILVSTKDEYSIHIVAVYKNRLASGKMLVLGKQEDIYNKKKPNDLYAGILVGEADWDKMVTALFEVLKRVDAPSSFYRTCLSALPPEEIH